MIKHGLSIVGPHKSAIVSAIKEAYRAGMNADVMQIAHKKEEGKS